jgi:hypothetical protein
MKGKRWIVISVSMLICLRVALADVIFMIADLN